MRICKNCTHFQYHGANFGDCLAPIPQSVWSAEGVIPPKAIVLDDDGAQCRAFKEKKDEGITDG